MRNVLFLRVHLVHNFLSQSAIDGRKHYNFMFARKFFEKLPQKGPELDSESGLGLDLAYFTLRWVLPGTGSFKTFLHLTRVSNKSMMMVLNSRSSLN